MRRHAVGPAAGFVVAAIPAGVGGGGGGGANHPPLDGDVVFTAGCATIPPTTPILCIVACNVSSLDHQRQQIIESDNVVIHQNKFTGIVGDGTAILVFFVWRSYHPIYIPEVQFL